MSTDSVYTSLDILARMCYDNADVHGFHEPNGTSRPVERVLLLICSELFEAFEAYREGVKESEKIPGFSNLEEEFADTIIRLLDTSKEYGLRIGDAVRAKYEYNARRPFKHNKAF